MPADMTARGPTGASSSGASRRRRWLRVVGYTVAVLLIGAVVGTWLWVRRPLPTTSGTITVHGSTAPIEILRDGHGIPHIRAASEEDAYFGLGFAHAQDRLWQMEFQRRIARGRLSELLGPRALDTDRLFRTLGLGRMADDTLGHLGADARRWLEAYARGVNACVTAPGFTLPIEFSIFGITPEPWQPGDSIAWVKVMAWGLDGHWRIELLRARLEERLGLDRAADLMPATTRSDPVIVPDFKAPAAAPAPSKPSSAEARMRFDWSATRPLLARDATTRELTGVGLPGAGSNSWVVAGSRTTTGRPILANDPHLAAQLPMVWYLAHVRGGGVDAIGATLPGLPGVVIGRNPDVAWGLTNLQADVQDLFIEHVRNFSEAEYQGAWEPMTLRHETIEVRGAPADRLVVRTTRHGPILTDVLATETAALALRWTALDEEDRTIEGLLGLQRARRFDAWYESARLFRSPFQNLVFADTSGTIAYVAPGALPARPKGDGARPVPGWTGEYDWAGLVPYEALPRVVNPNRGFIVTANNRAVPADQLSITTAWEAPYRAARITAMVEASPRVSPDAVARMQGDVQSAHAGILRAWLLSQVTPSARTEPVLALVRAWDGQMNANSAGAAVYQAWYGKLREILFGDELGDALTTEYLDDDRFAAMALEELIATDAAARWCDDVRTPATESCAEAVSLALERGLERGGDPQESASIGDWQWGRINEVPFAHTPLAAAPVVGRLFSRALSAGGDRYTVNPVMRIRGRVIVSSYRQVVDLSTLDGSRFMATVGQSGHVASPHYDDMVGPWGRGEYWPMLLSPDAVDASTVDRLTLLPAPP